MTAKEGSQFASQQATKMLRQLEWSGVEYDLGGDGFPACPICGGVEPLLAAFRVFKESAIGHKPNCELAELLNERV